MTNCKLCGKEIPPSHVQQGGLHIKCHDTEIDVFFVALVDAPRNGFYQRKISSVAEAIKHADYNDEYLVRREYMTAGRYFNLPDFEGF